MDNIEKEIKELSEKFLILKNEIHKNVIGQEHLIKSLIISLLCNGHILLEGLPGLAKTLSVKTLSEAVSVAFKRIQFTQDLLPGDLLGTTIFEQSTLEFKVKKGPIFTNFLLADEINRAPAKVQSALLECMQEKQVTLGHETFELPSIFIVLATQNPIEQEGTYHLPEAQLDRFMMKIKVDYPSKSEEIEILNMSINNISEKKVQKVLTEEEIFKSRELLNKIYIDDKMKKYIVDIVYATRNPEEIDPQLKELIEYGASPRATIFISLYARALAFLDGRNFVLPEDVKESIYDILNHRIVLSYHALADDIKPEKVIKRILELIKIP